MKRTLWAAARLLCLLSIVQIVSAASALASASAAASIPAAQAGAPLPLDPLHASPAWSAGAIPPLGGFQNVTTRARAGFSTAVWMLYDAHTLYVAFHCEQAGTPIVASQATNDVGFGNDDFVGVGIDPSGDGTQVYYFEATPRGVRYEQASENARYAPAWQAAGHIGKGAWDAVLHIPLSALRIHGGDKQTWRINFIRNVSALGEHYTWAYDGLMQDGQIGGGWPSFTDARWWPAWTGVTLSGLRGGLRAKPRAELYALESLGRDRALFAQANGSFQRQSVRVAGIDFTYPITDTINFVGTLNPDFSNVEIDQQTIAPQEFRRNLREYRPFFAQGANFLNPNAVPFTTAISAPNQVFYSPSVGPFDRGAKVEGAFGDQAFGALNFRGFDETTGNTFDDTAYGYRHALPDRTFLYWVDGVLAHHSVFGSDATTEAGIAGRNLKTGFVWGVDHAAEHGSWVPQGTSQSSNGFVDVHKPNWELNLTYADLSPNYNPIDGFTNTSDLHGFNLFADTTASNRLAKNFFAFAGIDRFADRSGAVHEADSAVFANATFRNGFSFDGIGGSISELRSYSLIDPATSGTTCADPALPRSYFTGYPSYFCGRTDTFNLATIPVGYGDGTATPIDASVSWGRFGYGIVGNADNGPDELHLYTVTASRPIARFLSLGLEYDGSFERALSTGAFDSQWLRRVSLGAQLGPNENLTLSLRAINGRGGFSLPGVDLAGAFHRRMQNGDELFLNFGTPAAPYTLDRWIAKYVFRFGSGAGT